MCVSNFQIKFRPAILNQNGPFEIWIAVIVSIRVISRGGVWAVFFLFFAGDVSEAASGKAAVESPESGLSKIAGAPTCYQSKLFCIS